MSDYVTQNQLEKTLRDNNKIIIDEVSEVMRDLMGHMDSRFKEQDERFDKVDAQLFKIEQRLDEHDKQLVELKTGQRKIFDILDSIAKKQEIDDDERLILQHQLDKMILWAKEVANKVGVELTSL